jgi:urease accessory protein UreE
MLLIEKLPEVDGHGHLVLAERERDTIVMTFEERRWLRRRATTASGRAIALALPTGCRLEPGAILAVEADWYLQVEAAKEPVLAVFPQDQSTAIRIAFEVGNHHFPLAVDGNSLLVPDDTAMTQLLTRLGVHWERREAVFDPIGRGHSHDD